MMRTALVLAAAALLVGGAGAPAAAAVEAVDDTGQRIVLPRPAKRVITLAPSATELVHAAGGGAHIVATVATSDWPPSARDLPRIGDAFAVDLERVAVLAPDLVVTWPYTVPAHVAQLRGRGIPVFVIDPRTIDAIPRAVRSLGALLGTARDAEPVAHAFEQRLAALRERYRGTRPLRVFYEVWGSPLYTIGRGHVITQAIELCGGRNVFADVDVPAPNITAEAVIAAQPDVIVAGAEGGRRPEWLDAWQRYPSIPAVAHGALHVVDADALHRPGPRFIDGVASLCATMDRARSR